MEQLQRHTYTKESKVITNGMLLRSWSPSATVLHTNKQQIFLKIKLPRRHQLSTCCTIPWKQLIFPCCSLTTTLSTSPILRILQLEKLRLLFFVPSVAEANMIKLPLGDPLSVNGVQLGFNPSSSCWKDYIHTHNIYHCVVTTLPHRILLYTQCKFATNLTVIKSIELSTFV